MKVLFISDLHLCEERPETIRAFLAFLRTPANGAQALYILGDLFEYWAGDDDDAPLNHLISQSLATLAEHGTQVFFIPGNRDFLLGTRFADASRLTLLADPTRIELDGQAVLLSHGDALCTDDAAYQHFRRQVRDAGWQQAFLAKPIAERKQFIEHLRLQSIAAKAQKQAEIMDVNPDAVAALLREHAGPTLIHGHTHRPARHVHIIDGKDCERWVLADWHDDAPYLIWHHGKLEARRFRAPQS